MMRYDTPLRKQHDDYVRSIGREHEAVDLHRPGAATGRRDGGEVAWLSYGPPDDAGTVQCEIPAVYTEIETEYAAIRNGSAIMDRPNRGTILVTGHDRITFLDRMVTQELKNLAPGRVRETFWLNRRGRIDADLRLIELGDRMLIDLDVHQVAHTIESLGSFIFTEEVEITDATESFHHLALHGPAATSRLVSCDSTEWSDDGSNDFVLECTVAHSHVVAARCAETGEPGFELIVPRDRASEIWSELVSSEAHPARPVGWYAYNIARIEAGTPIFNVDFGANNLPHETGVLDQRVSFTKGCYLGQEIVARMQSLGKPKQQLAGLRIEDDVLPDAGSPVLSAADSSVDEPIGVITSSTLSPMLGSSPIAFAMIRTKEGTEGTSVRVQAEGREAKAVIAPLQFWSRQAATR